MFNLVRFLDTLPLCLTLFGLCPHIFFIAVQISNEANQCLNVLLGKYDPFRCLAVCTNILLLFSFFASTIYYTWTSMVFGSHAGYSAPIGQ
jgi:hypothetical protein